MSGRQPGSRYGAEIAQFLHMPQHRTIIIIGGETPS